MPHVQVDEIRKSLSLNDLVKVLELSLPPFVGWEWQMPPPNLICRAGHVSSQPCHPQEPRFSPQPRGKRGPFAPGGYGWKRDSCRSFNAAGSVSSARGLV